MRRGEDSAMLCWGEERIWDEGFRLELDGGERSGWVGEVMGGEWHARHDSRAVKVAACGQVKA